MDGQCRSPFQRKVRSSDGATSMLDQLGYYTSERQRIWFVREHGAVPPWTTDLVFATNRFTNVYRELDPGTIYAHECIAKCDDRRHAVWWAVVYRMLNRK